MNKNLPKIEFAIIGAQKAGTTSLKTYLHQHPDIFCHPQTEFGYFVRDEEFNSGYEKALKKYFSKHDQQKLLIKHAGLSCSESSLERLKKHNPECKLIFVLRNPVQRAHSAFWMEKNYGWLKRDIIELGEVAVSGKTEDILHQLFLKMGDYSEQLDLIFKYFPRKNVFIYIFDKMRSDEQIFCNRIFQDIGLRTFDIDKNIKDKNTSGKPRSPFYQKMILRLEQDNNSLKKIAKLIVPHNLISKIGHKLRAMNKKESANPPLDSLTKNRLLEYFLPSIQKLESDLKLDLSKWKHQSN